MSILKLKKSITEKPILETVDAIDSLRERSNLLITVRVDQKNDLRCSMRIPTFLLAPFQFLASSNLDEMQGCMYHSR